jgi:hypothetical protein
VAERDVERVLLVVVDGVDAEVAGHAAREHAFEVAEHVRERGEFLAGPDAGEKFLDRRHERREPSSRAPCR